jgi:hypothetical protein
MNVIIKVYGLLLKHKRWFLERKKEEFSLIGFAKFCDDDDDYDGAYMLLTTVGKMIRSRLVGGNSI